MNTHTTAHKAKIRHLCSCLVLCLHLASGAVPGPCQHSVTEEHLLTLRKLIMNQVLNGCSISFRFTEHQHLSDICYIKAALPHVLDLLNAHFTYEKESDNYHYTSSLKELIYNIYSQKCIPPIDEEIEENPVKFARLYTTLPREGLQKTEEVLRMFKKLMIENNNPVNWNCEDEYANNAPESTTAPPTETTECKCSCLQPTMFTRSAPTASSASPYTQSRVYTFKNKTEGSRAPEPTGNDKANNSTPSQIFVLSPGPGPFPSLKPELFTDQHSVAIHEESTNFITSTTPNLMDTSSGSSVAMRSEAQSVTSSPISSLIELPGIPTRTVQSATSHLSEKINRPLISDRKPLLHHAKRSLDTREQGMLSGSSSDLLQRIRRNKKFKVLEITPGETENQQVEQIIPAHLHLQMTNSLPRNVLKIISEDPDCKDSRCTEDRSDQRSRDRVKRDSEEEEYKLIQISVCTVFLITAVCVLLLFITVLIYCKQQRVYSTPAFQHLCFVCSKIKDFQKEDRTVHI